MFSFQGIGCGSDGGVFQRPPHGRFASAPKFQSPCLSWFQGEWERGCARHLLHSQWTVEREALLKELWESGLSASQCAAQLGGVTRSAITGLAFDTGIWGSNAARTLTALQFDTGVADTVWKYGDTGCAPSTYAPCAATRALPSISRSVRRAEHQLRYRADRQRGGDSRADGQADVRRDSAIRSTWVVPDGGS